MSEKNVKDSSLKITYNENDEQIYPITCIKAVEGLNDTLNVIDNKIITNNLNAFDAINDIKKDVDYLKNNQYDDTYLKNKVNEIENSIKEIDTVIKSLKVSVDNLLKMDHDRYNLHLIKNEDNYYTVIENFSQDLLDDNRYRLVFMKKSRRSTTGKSWTVPMFNDKDIENKYYYDNNKALLNPTKAFWPITSYKQQLWNGKYSIKDLPCVSIIKDKSLLGKKMFPHYKSENDKTILYKGDQSYIFKNSNNKKLKIGFAIFKKNENEKWIRVSNIAEIELYAYDINKYLINMI